MWLVSRFRLIYVSTFIYLWTCSHCILDFSFILITLIILHETTTCFAEVCDSQNPLRLKYPHFIVYSSTHYWSLFLLWILQNCKNLRYFNPALLYNLYTLKFHVIKFSFCPFRTYGRYFNTEIFFYRRLMPLSTDHPGRRVRSNNVCRETSLPLSLSVCRQVTWRYSRNKIFVRVTDIRNVVLKRIWHLQNMLQWFLLLVIC